jgi:phospholipase C
VDHVVVVMMENRSFDHYLGSLSLEEGWAIDGLTGEEQNPDLAGSPVGVFPLAEPCQSDPPHGWSSSHQQFAEGANDGFVREHESRVGESQGDWVMGYYRRDRLPVHYALADAFAVPERWFCSVLGPTWPNRFFGHAGTSMGRTGNSLPSSGFTDTTVYRALEEGGEDWRYYYTDVPFIGLLKDHWDGGRVRPVTDFFSAAERGDLPAFTWIDPGFGFNDDHPPHHPGLGQIFLGSIYEALARSPAWERCLLVITYDEHGGFFDHVPPPTTEDDREAEGFDRVGFRVPSLLVGPWVRQGVDATFYDHTSVLAYVCERFGLEPWNRRIAAANSIGSVLDAERMAAGTPLEAPLLPTVTVPEEELGDQCQYGGLHFSKQPELEDWVRENMPETLLIEEQPAIRKALLERALDSGLLGPANLDLG